MGGEALFVHCLAPAVVDDDICSRGRRGLVKAPTSQ